MTKEEEIVQLEASLTGDMFKDMDIKDEIHRLKLEFINLSAVFHLRFLIKKLSIIDEKSNSLFNFLVIDLVYVSQ